jgi:hypothetical protein
LLQNKEEKHLKSETRETVVLLIHNRTDRIVHFSGLAIINFYLSTRTMVLQESVEYYLHTQNDRWVPPASPHAPPRKAKRTPSDTLLFEEVAAFGDLSGSDDDMDSSHSSRWNPSSSCHDRAISIPRRHSRSDNSRASRWYETLAFDDHPRHPIQKRLSSTKLLAMKITVPSV